MHFTQLMHIKSIQSARKKDSFKLKVVLRRRRDVYFESTEVVELMSHLKIE